MAKKSKFYLKKNSKKAPKKLYEKQSKKYKATKKTFYAQKFENDYVHQAQPWSS